MNNKWVVRVENAGQIGWLNNQNEITTKRSEARHIATPGSAAAVMVDWIKTQKGDDFTGVAVANTFVDEMTEEKTVSFVKDEVGK